MDSPKFYRRIYSRLNIFIIIFILLSFNSLAVDTCIWEIVTRNDIQFSYGYNTNSIIENNVLRISFYENFNNVKNMEINMQYNSTYIDYFYIRELINLQMMMNICSYSEYWYNNYLISELILNENNKFYFQSRIWRNENRLHDSNTLR